jgi:peptide/nickel transport system permease protein
MMNMKPNTKDIMQEELVQSPGRTAIRNFMEKKHSVAGMVTFLAIFSFIFLASWIVPIDVFFMDSTQRNIPPSQNFLRLPSELRGNIGELSLGATFGTGIDRNGGLHQWGTYSGTSARVASDTPVGAGPWKLVASGHDHVSAVAMDGRVYSWGNTRLGITDVPSRVQGRNIIELEAGYQTTMALDDQGVIYFWGNSNFFVVRPEAHQGRYRSFAMNVESAIAILDDHTVVCLSGTAWTRNIPDAVQGRTRQVAINDRVAAAVLFDNTVVTWGSRFHPAFEVPERIQGRVVDLQGGKEHFTALLDDGSVVSWGNSLNGAIRYPKGTGFTRIVVNYYQNAAIDANGNAVTWGNKGYIMGTDELGRDIFSRLIHGGRISLTVGFVAVIITSFLGVLIGGVSGYYGGKIDMFLQRVAETVQGIPNLPLLMLLSAVMRQRLDEQYRIVIIMVLIGILTWPGLNRITRGQVLFEKNQEFITSAKAMGIREGKIIFRHILPNILPIILVNITLGLATCMLIESNLSFLGFGVSDPDPSWGNMLTASMDSTVIQNFWWRWVFPSAFLGLTVISINLMGDGLRDAVDPKSNNR